MSGKFAKHFGQKVLYKCSHIPCESLQCEIFDCEENLFLFLIIKKFNLNLKRKFKLKHEFKFLSSHSIWHNILVDTTVHSLPVNRQKRETETCAKTFFRMCLGGFSVYCNERKILQSGFGYSY